MRGSTTAHATSCSPQAKRIAGDASREYVLLEGDEGETVAESCAVCALPGKGAHVVLGALKGEHVALYKESTPARTAVPLEQPIVVNEVAGQTEL